jgi:hypothetical protein
MSQVTIAISVVICIAVSAARFEPRRMRSPGFDEVAKIAKPTGSKL